MLFFLQLDRLTGTGEKKRKPHKPQDDGNLAANTATAVAHKLSEKEVITLFEKMLVSFGSVFNYLYISAAQGVQFLMNTVFFIN